MNSQVQPFKIDLSSRVPHMLDLIRRTSLPSRENPAAKNSLNSTISSGIPLATLQSLKQEWLANFDWDVEQASLNTYKKTPADLPEYSSADILRSLNHYTTEIEGLDIHFIREESAAQNAIPIILFHGWPGSFLEMVPLIDLLAVKNKASTGVDQTAFDVIIPSLPGFGFSSPAPDGWSVADTARVFDKLMHQILGYKTYAVHGTDWGSAVAYELYKEYSRTVRAAHLNFLPFIPMNFEQLAAANVTLPPEEVASEQLNVDWESSGNGYFIEQTTRPNTVGLSLFDNPIGQLAWLAEKFISWSDPRQGTGPSLLNHHEILRHVSLYYLTETIVSSVYMYYQNPHGFSTNYAKPNTDAPLLYSTFSHNVGFWPKGLVEKVGNLVSYSFHEFGGHFPALDNPPALAGDIRSIAKFWQP